MSEFINTQLTDGKDKSKKLLPKTTAQNVFRANGQNVDVALNNIEANAVDKNYIKDNYYDKSQSDALLLQKASTGDLQALNTLLTEKINTKLSTEEYNTLRDSYVKNGLVNNSLSLTDEEKLKIETWLGLSENYLTTYNTTPYVVEGQYNPTHKKYVDEKIAEVELYKFPNVTIIGEPTITHGQISDFSATSYLKFPFLVDFHSQPFEINMQFTTGTNVTNQENIFDSDFGLAFAIRSGRFVIAISTNGTSWNLGEGVGTYVVQPRTTYYVRLSWNKMLYKLEYSLDGKTYTTDITKTATVQPYPKQIYIGVGENFAEVVNHFSGIVNLNNANLKILGEIVWQGMDDAGLATRLDTSLSNVDKDGENKIREIAHTNTIENTINGMDTLVQNPQYQEYEFAEMSDLNGYVKIDNMFNSTLLSDVVGIGNYARVNYDGYTLNFLSNGSYTNITYPLIVKAGKYSVTIDDCDENCFIEFSDFRGGLQPTEGVVKINKNSKSAIITYASDGWAGLSFSNENSVSGILAFKGITIRRIDE